MDNLPRLVRERCEEIKRQLERERMTYCKACADRRDGVYGSWAPDCPEHSEDGTPRTQQIQGVVPVPPMVQVPLAFVIAFRRLVHNYSLEVVPPDLYCGVEKDAYRAAFRRCGQELAEAEKLLGTIK